MSAELKVYAGKELSAQDFAVLMECSTPSRKGVLRGCAVTATAPSGGKCNINIATGWCVVRGRLVKITSTTISNYNLPSSGIRYSNVILEVSLASPGTARIFASQNVPSDTSNFNTTSNAVAYLVLATFTCTSSGISDITNADKITIDRSNQYYTYTKTVKNLFSNKKSYYTMKISRFGNVVNFYFEYVGIVPKDKLGKVQEIGEKIPEGYRPINYGSIHIPYHAVAGNAIQSGRGVWIVKSSGKIEGLTNTSAYVERIGSASWITRDDPPS